MSSFFGKANALIEGRIMTDLTLNKTAAGVPVVSFPVAINHLKRKNEDGSEQEVPPTVIRVTAWRGVAEYIVKNGKKGSGFAAECSLSKTETKSEKDGKVYHSMEATPVNGQLPDIFDIANGSLFLGYAALILRGRLAADGDLRTTENGRKFLNMQTIINFPATKGDDGNYVERPAFSIRGVAFGKDAEFYATRTPKGRVVSGLYELVNNNHETEKDGVTHVYRELEFRPYRFAPPHDLIDTKVRGAAEGDGGSSGNATANSPAETPKTESKAGSFSEVASPDWGSLADENGEGLPW